MDFDAIIKQVTSGTVTWPSAIVICFCITAATVITLVILKEFFKD